MHMALAASGNGTNHNAAQGSAKLCTLVLEGNLTLNFSKTNSLLHNLSLSDPISGNSVEWAEHRARRRRIVPSTGLRNKQIAFRNEAAWSDTSIQLVTCIGRYLSAGTMPPAWPAWSSASFAASAENAAPVITATAMQLPTAVQHATGLQASACLRLASGPAAGQLTLAYLTPSHCVVSKPVQAGSQLHTARDLVTVCDISVAFRVLQRHWGQHDCWVCVADAWDIMMQRLPAIAALCSSGAPAAQSSGVPRTAVPVQTPSPIKLSPWHPRCVQAQAAVAQKLSTSCGSALGGAAFALATSRMWLLQA